MVNVDSSNRPPENDPRGERRKGSLLAALAATVVAILILTSLNQLPGEESVPTTLAEASPTTRVVPAPTPSSVTGDLGVATLQFGENELEASFDECDLEPLRSGETFRAGGLQLPATDQHGVEWTIRVIINHYGPGTYHFAAIGPDGNPGYQIFSPSDKTDDLVAKIDDRSAVFQTAFFPRSEGELEIPVIITVDCIQRTS
jgi:hypothetical protein